MKSKEPKRYGKLTMWVGRIIWTLAERCGIQLGKMAPIVFGWMVGVKGIPIPLVHGAMQYSCDKCGAQILMWLEVGVEKEYKGRKRQPCPYTILHRDSNCMGVMKHVHWDKDIKLEKERHIGHGEYYFAYDDSGNDMACGIPKRYGEEKKYV